MKLQLLRCVKSGSGTKLPTRLVRSRRKRTIHPAVMSASVMTASRTKPACPPRLGRKGDFPQAAPVRPL